MFYLEFGNEEEVPLHRLQTLSADLASLPPLTVQLALSPADVTPDQGSGWSDEATSKFSGLVLDKEVNIVITCCIRELVHCGGMGQWRSGDLHWFMYLYVIHAYFVHAFVLAHACVCACICTCVYVCTELQVGVLPCSLGDTSGYRYEVQAKDLTQGLVEAGIAKPRLPTEVLPSPPSQGEDSVGGSYQSPLPCE